MIQKFTTYRVGNLPADIDHLARYFGSAEFTPTTATQDHAIGFVPPRGHGEAMAEAVAGHWIGRAMIERRKVPTAALKKRVDDEADKIEQATGRKPGKKERRALKEDALLALLPQAFPKQVAVPVWIDRQAGILVIGATSQVVVDDVITLLVRAVPDLTLSPLMTRLAPGSLMAGWLVAHEAERDFSLGRECELKSNDEERAAVRYSHHDLHGDEVKRHIAEGKLPKRLAIDWKGRVAFRLSDTFAIDKVQLLDAAVAERADDADAFDADVTICCGELAAMMADLIDVLGGEMQAQEGAAA